MKGASELHKSWLIICHQMPKKAYIQGEPAALYRFKSKKYAKSRSLMDIGQQQQQQNPQQQQQPKSLDLDCNADEVVLPGFRFHPTDEELVTFYLRRKVQQRPLSIELIKQLDIYKFDPWDLPKMSTIGEREWYFFCPRDRKYRNSNRPNRVTSAGFWKATGTDRPIYSSDGSKCIGLKKSLVFYRGRAAKGLKTDWMMHEFRLPTSSPCNKPSVHKDLTPNDSWAICRIFKKSTIAQRAPPHMWAASAATAATPVPVLDAMTPISSSSCTNTAINGRSDHDLQHQQDTYFAYSYANFCARSTPHDLDFSATTTTDLDFQSCTKNSSISFAAGVLPLHVTELTDNGGSGTTESEEASADEQLLIRCKSNEALSVSLSVSDSTNNSNNNNGDGSVLQFHHAHLYEALKGHVSLAPWEMSVATAAAASSLLL